MPLPVLTISSWICSDTTNMYRATITWSGTLRAGFDGVAICLSNKFFVRTRRVANSNANAQIYLKSWQFGLRIQDSSKNKKKRKKRNFAVAYSLSDLYYFVIRPEHTLRTLSARLVHNVLMSFIWLFNLIAVRCAAPHPRLILATHRIAWVALQQGNTLQQF